MYLRTHNVAKRILNIVEMILTFKKKQKTLIYVI